MPFTDLPTLKAIMRIPALDTSRDVELAVYVDAANGMLYSLFGGLTDSAPTSYSEKVSIDDPITMAFHTRKWPVTAVATLEDNDSPVASTEFAFEDYGLVHLTDALAYFSFGRNIVEITYTAGFPPGHPGLAELKLAATQIAAYNANVSAHGGVQKETIGQYSYELGAGAKDSGSAGGGGFGIPPSAERILANWTRPQVWPNAG